MADHDCACGDPNWISHAGWWRCANCLGWLPALDRAEAIAFMRQRIDEGRAHVARERR
jgi:hypothetical protein